MMQPEHGSQRYIPHHPQVPFGTRQAVLEEQISAELSAARRSGEVATKAQAILREHREGVIQLLGSEKYEKFRSYLEEQKRFKAKFFFPPRGPEMSTQEIERYQRERKEESVAWFNKQGIDAHKLRDLSRKAAAALKEFDPVHPYQGDKRSIILPSSEVPPAILAHKTNPWTIARPPYGWGWWYNGSLAGFGFTPTLYLDASIGLVGNINHIEDSDASDNDYGYIQYAANVYFWFQMPTPGLIEVWIEAGARGSHHRLDLWDEWGWSDGSANQHNYLTLNASVGGSSSALQMAETSWFTETGQTEGHWDNSYFTNGETFWANLTSDRNVIYPAGSWVLVEVGTINFNSSLANDVSTYSTLDAGWFIKSVSVHSTGG
jgi:hypothetical protein